MKKNNYSKRDYTKKIYSTADKKDLRKSFPNNVMIVWALIYFIIGAGLIWYAIALMDNTLIYYLFLLLDCGL